MLILFKHKTLLLNFCVLVYASVSLIYLNLTPAIIIPPNSGIKYKLTRNVLDTVTANSTVI